MAAEPGVKDCSSVHVSRIGRNTDHLNGDVCNGVVTGTGADADAPPSSAKTTRRVTRPTCEISGSSLAA